MFPRGAFKLFEDLYPRKVQQDQEWRVSGADVKDKAGNSLKVTDEKFFSTFQTDGEPRCFIISSPAWNFRELKSKNERSFQYLSVDATSNLQLEHSKVTALFNRGDHLDLRKCKIGYLILEDRKRAMIARVRNCEIGSLAIECRSPLTEIHFENCKILSFRFVRKNAEPFELSFKDCHFETVLEPIGENEILPENEDQLPLVKLQGFRDLSRWAQDNGMSELAHQARGAELGLEYSTQGPGIEKLALLIWRVTSEYGMRPGKALKILFISTAALWFILLCGGTEVRDGAPLWVGSLGGFGRAFVAAGTNIISPYAGLSARSLVQPANAMGAFFMALHGVVTVAQFLFIGFSLRRRFRFS